MKKINSYGLLIFLFIFTACGSVKEIGANTENMKTSTFIQNVEALKPQFVHLSIQSKINAEIDGNPVGLNGKIYIRNGQKIWINVSKFGINAARAEITPSGLKAYEKVNRTFIDGDFSYFNQLLKVNFITYDKLQNLLLGRLFLELKPNDFQLNAEKGSYVLTYNDNEKLEQKPKNGKYIQIYTFDNQFRLTKAYLKDPKSGKELEISYSKWTTVGIQYFPKNVIVLVKDKKTQKVELEYNNFTFDESSTPFSIPSGYKPNTSLK
ncbi:MAG: DUF4292 domain-containing protein [Weeksellaceae bacterium]|nr:DUF4292 domain-containing protein [Weeksellaceae bacterium]